MAEGYGALMELDPDEAIEDPTDIMARVIAAAEGKVCIHTPTYIHTSWHASLLALRARSRSVLGTSSLRPHALVA